MLVNSFAGACGVFSLCVLLLADGTEANKKGTCKCDPAYISNVPKPANAADLAIWEAVTKAKCATPIQDDCIAPCKCFCPLKGMDTSNWPTVTCTDGSDGAARCVECRDDDDCAGANEVCCPTKKVCEVPVPENPQLCDDPHMTGLRGQKIDWSGVDGGWYCLVKDDDINLQVNVRLTAPLPHEFPDRQLITGLSILSEGHSLVVEVNDPYNVNTDGCPDGVSPCLSNGGLFIATDGERSRRLLHPTRHEYVGGGMHMSASNLPVECRLFSGSTVWAQMYEEMVQGSRQLSSVENFEDWVMTFDHVAAPEWCAKYIEERGLVDVQSAYALFRVSTPTANVQLHVGVDHQGGDQLNWDGRVLPDLDFWQMDVGVHGLSLGSQTLTGILGETARPVLDEYGHQLMEGYDAMRGTVADYRVSGALGSDFALLHDEQVA